MSLSYIHESFKDIEKKKMWQAVFQKIEMDSSEFETTEEEGKKVENAELNRYTNVLPYDHTRVLLSNGGYINANHVFLSGTNLNLILTQGPMSNTQSDFWQMIWEKKCTAIVMLTRFVESGRPKSFPYLPSCHGNTNASNVLTVDSYEIRESDLVKQAHFDVRKLILLSKKSEEQRVVKHYHLKCWPDFDVPESTDYFLEVLAELYKEDSMDGRSPTVVHCSAGVGRSGTFAAVYACLLKIRATNELNDFNLPELVVELRKCRMGLVQTPEQLRYCWKVVLDAVGSSKWRPLLGLPEPLGSKNTSDVAATDGETETSRPTKRRRSEKDNSNVLDVIDASSAVPKIADENSTDSSDKH
ncbi:Y phosphatase domain containing protein [Trichuris trichiura]|uniref:protein-tyrosine-phosphatase n=1 Tax=Trichuris trichiura TaxID=36087 RepID=A0A077ZG23_TRITR|nr:Y phosphatase domain containing protein [Trichuris trichiura]